GADSSPRRAPTATGKNERNAPSTVTESQRGHSHPNSSSLPPQLTTSGARAISGTVWETTRYGSKPRRTTPKRAITVANAIPTRLPSTKPVRARRNEYQAASRTTSQMCLLEVRLSGSNSRRPMSHTWGIAVSFARGRMRAPSTSPPVSGPTSLYSSHAAATSTNARRNRAILRIIAERARRARPSSQLGELGRGERRDHVLPVGLQGAVLAVVLEVDGELVDAQLGELVEPPEVLVDGAEDA